MNFITQLGSPLENVKRVRENLYTSILTTRLSRLVVAKVLHFGFANVTRASAGSADVKIFINCVAVLAGRGDDTSPENVSGCT